MIMQDDFIKITQTAYRLIDFFPDNDPLKNKAKEKVLAIMENLMLMYGTKGWISLQTEKAAAQLIDDICMLENYLKIANYQKWIDNINFLIIVKEYQALKGAIRPPKPIVRQALVIASGAHNNKEVSGEKALKSETILLPKARENLSERQEKILHIMGGREKTQVADIIKQLPNITKRTIRRDLDDLLKRGRVARIGEWNQVFYQITKKHPKIEENSSNLDGTIILS
jgi:hypothetical protein